MVSTRSEPVGAIVAAAGRSTRMGQPKQLLPWGDSTIVATVVQELSKAGVTPVLVVTGHEAEAVTQTLSSTDAIIHFNASFATDGLLQSFQKGLQHIQQDNRLRGVLLCLGDQPHISFRVHRSILMQTTRSHKCLVIPRFQGRRGHPIYVPASLWPDMFSLGPNETLRTLVKRNEDSILYVDVESDDILRDIDTPEDYASFTG